LGFRSDLELRGLDKDKNYEVYDYANDKKIDVLYGSNPILHYGFKGSLLIKVKPMD
jgi:hypothetical protein